MPTVRSPLSHHPIANPGPAVVPRPSARQGARPGPGACPVSGADHRGPGADHRGPGGHPPDTIGPLLARLRKGRGWSQPHLADRLCAAAGVPTVSRNEVSRWERQSRVPGPFWLSWLATVLDAPPHLLTAARAAAAPITRPEPPGVPGRQWPAGTLVAGGGPGRPPSGTLLRPEDGRC